MPGAATLTRGNIIMEELIVVTLATPQVLANTSTVQTYTIPGLQVNDFIEINQLSHIVGLTIGNVWVSANNVLSIQFANVTTSTINASTAQYILNIDRMENAALGLSAFPNGIY